MCEDYSTKTMVAASQGAISTLITMLGASDVDAVYNSLGTLEKLMADYQVTLFSPTSILIKNKSNIYLQSTNDDYQPRQIIRELRGIEPIMSLMKSDFPQIQELVFSALAKITQNGIDFKSRVKTIL